MLRPATPLFIILLVAFVLLLLSTISTPIIKAIPLGTYQGWSFGVFGYCKADTCLGPHIGYSTDGLFADDSSGDFTLPSSTRHSLSAILIVHPIAAFLTLVCCILAGAAHFHAPASSPRYLLALLILTVPTLLVSLLAFLVDILLFVPHMGWGGWIVLGSTILIVASSILTCVMRRTLVSRKARKKRIAENAEMNGSNYYETLNQQRMLADQLPRADSPPPIHSASADKAGPQFAAFETKHHDPMTHDSAARTSEDRAPLNPGRDHSIRSTSTGGGRRRPYDMGDAPPMPMNGPPGSNSPRRPSMDDYGNSSPGPNGSRRPSRDEYGNPIPAAIAGGMAGAAGAGIMRRQDSPSGMGSNGGGARGGVAPYGRGRGYGPPSRGYGQPSRGYGPPRGGYGGPPRGGDVSTRGSYGPRAGFRGGPPQGWNSRGRGGYGSPPGSRGPPPPGYAGDPYYGRQQQQQQQKQQQAALSPVSPMDRTPPPHHDNFIARGHSPANPDHSIGQAIEMDERTGSPPMPNNYQSATYGLRDSDRDVAGMVGLQQGRQYAPSPMRHGSDSRSAGSPGGFSGGNYVPPRAGWKQAEARSHFSPDNTESGLSSNQSLPMSGNRQSPAPQNHAMSGGGGHARAGSEPYYEDVDPRFQADGHTAQEQDQDQHTALPSSLMPGSAYGAHAHRMPSPNHLHPPLPASLAQTDRSNSTPSLEDRLSENLPEGTRSPAGSDTSHFTSISQRPVNPNWRPGWPSGPDGGPVPSSVSAAQRRKEDIILTANPDFSIPGVTPSRGRGRGRGGGMARGAGLTPAGRYPTEF